MSISNKEIEVEIIDYLKKGNPQIFKLESISKDESLIELGYIDSFGIIDLITYFENKWKIKIKNEEITPKYFGSINKIISIFEEKLSLSS